MKSYVKNTLILSICIVVSKLIGAIYKIMLSNVLGTQGMGIFQLVFPVYSLVLVVITGGMPIYIAQRVAYFRAKKQKNQIAKLLKNCFVLCLILAILFATIFVVFCKQIAKWQGNDFAYLGYIIVGISIIFSAVTCVIKGYFIGVENVTPNALGGILENLCKFLFGILFSYLLFDYGLEYAVAGGFVGVLIGEIVTFFYLIVKYNQNKLKCKSYISYATIKNIFVQYLPLSLASIILPVSACIDSFLVVNLLSTSTTVEQATSLFGIATGMISPIIHFPVMLCSTIAVAFLPTLTYAIEQKQEIKSMIGGTYFFVWFLSLPCAMGIFVLSPMIIKICFSAIESGFVGIASNYLSISCFNIVFLVISQISCSILNSLHKFYLPFICQLVGLIIKLLSLILLILYTDFGIISLAISLLFSNGISCFLVVLLAKKNLNLHFNISKFFIPLLSSLVMLMVIVFISKYLAFNYYAQFLFLTGVGIVTYFAICIVFGIVKMSEIKSIFGRQNSNGNLT